MERRMKVNLWRLWIWGAMVLALVGLIMAIVHQSASGALISAGGLFAGFSLLPNAHLLRNNIQDIPATVQSGGYDLGRRYYGRAGGLLVVTGFVVALIGH
jgi:hypothetical protein